MTRPLAARGAALAITCLATVAVAALSARAGAAAPPPSAGERLFRQRCASCHQIAPGARSIMGPNLARVVGRAPGADPAFRYSQAISRLDQPWDRARLDAFLAAPAKVAPGTRMLVSVREAQDREAIIAYLAATGP